MSKNGNRGTPVADAAFDTKLVFAESTVHLLRDMAERGEARLLPLAEVVDFMVRWLERLELARPRRWRAEKVGSLLHSARHYAAIVDRLAERDGPEQD